MFFEDFFRYHIDIECIIWVKHGTSNLLKGVKFMAIDQKLLEILACPKCKGDLIITKENDGLVCNSCKLLYPIRDDIPIMLIDEAINIE